MANITLDQLTKVFGGHRAIDGLSLGIADGEILALLGPSGCGKTTTMNCIAGLETPSEGRVLFDGVDVTAMPPHQRNIAMVFQASTLYPHLTARQNIAMSLRRSGKSAAEIANLVAEAAATVDVTRLLDRLPSQLSGGERQRVATAKAIVRQPAVFLLDEPLASLDAALRLTLRSELVNLQKRLRTTMVFVTHDQSEAMTMGDRIAVMRDGRVEQIGTPEEIYNAPATRFVAGFIGSPPMSLLAGAIVEDTGRSVFAANGARVELGALGGLPPGSPVTLGVRPEHLSVAPRRTEEAIQCKVFAVEHLGRESILVADTPDGTRIRAILEPGAGPNVGEEVRLRVRSGGIVHLFDRRAGGEPALGKFTA